MVTRKQRTRRLLMTLVIATRSSSAIHDEQSSFLRQRRNLQYKNDGRCIGWRNSCGGYEACCKFINVICGDQGQTSENNPCARFLDGRTTSSSVSSFAPSSSSSMLPSSSPIISSPSTLPSTFPSSSPSRIPSFLPSLSSYPSSIPSNNPSQSIIPSSSPSHGPSMFPTTSTPTSYPSEDPTHFPTVSPSSYPTQTPTLSPTPGPSISPSSNPSRTPYADAQREYSWQNDDEEDPTESPSTSPSTPPPTKETIVCGAHIPDPTEENTLMAFIAFGDTPYDEQYGSPFEGDEYECLDKVTIPGIKALHDVVDWAVHIGDIKKGNTRYQDYCTQEVFNSRKDLFAKMEPNYKKNGNDGVDFLLLVGDNEWNECVPYEKTKQLWRDTFATSNPFNDFDRTLPYGGDSVSIERQSGTPENYYFYYDNFQLAFFGITEPSGDIDHDSINANWISQKMTNLIETTGQLPRAMVLAGHSGMSGEVLSVLEDYRSIPTLYVNGNSHAYDFECIDGFPNIVELTVEAFDLAPMLVTLVQNGDGDVLFHVQRLGDLCCASPNKCFGTR